ncbi:MFS transporter [Alcaligenaceae bacterium B3P038]|nr:MFS transporter [Alcaligenaceae bacterium B3P038]
MESSTYKTPKSSQGLRAYVVSATGTTLEWYDFAVYSAASALVFGQVFFHADDPLIGTLLAFATYAVGYAARPIGGIIFGRLGDIVGRKKVLVWTLMLIGISTLLIGLVPGYATLGAWAPALLIVLRLCQGVGVGGEWAGAVLIAAEHGDPKKRGLMGSAAQIGPPLGNLLANGVLALLAVTLSSEEFMAWGWRLAFLLSAVLIAFGLWIRLRIEETPVFEELKETGQVARSPLKEVWQNERRNLVAATLVRICPDVMYGMSTVFVLTYATRHHGLLPSQALTAVMIGSGLQAFMVPAAAHLSDRFNRRSVYAFGALCSIAWPFVFFPVMANMGYTGVILAVIGGLFCNSIMYGPQAALVSEQFSPRLRYAGSSLAYTFGGLLGGALAPLMFTWLLGRFGTWQPLAAYIVFVSVVTLAGVRMARDPAENERTAVAAPLSRGEER